MTKYEERSMCIDMLWTDIQMLYDGEWEPDHDSIAATLDTIQKLADSLGIDPRDLRDEID